MKFISNWNYNERKKNSEMGPGSIYVNSLWASDVI